jgi:hypothetical protein
VKHAPCPIGQQYLAKPGERPGATRYKKNRRCQLYPIRSRNGKSRNESCKIRVAGNFGIVTAKRAQQASKRQMIQLFLSSRSSLFPLSKNLHACSPPLFTALRCQTSACSLAAERRQRKNYINHGDHLCTFPGAPLWCVPSRRNDWRSPFPKYPAIDPPAVDAGMRNSKEPSNQRGSAKVVALSLTFPTPDGSSPAEAPSPSLTAQLRDAVRPMLLTLVARQCKIGRLLSFSLASATFLYGPASYE